MIENELRESVKTIYTRSTYLADLVRLMTKAADEIERLRRDCAEATPPTILTLPQAEIHLQSGEHYAGQVLNQDGTPSHYLILLPGHVQKPWDDAMKWAASIGGELPTRNEQALLYANLKGKFEASWYWSSEQYSEGSAWGQVFDGGSQTDRGKSFHARARAVRRLVIE